MSPSRTPYRMTPVEPVTAPRLLGGWWIPDAAWTVLRVAVAALLIWHGVQEHFGLLIPPGATWRGAPVPFTESWYAATIEILGGALLAIGLFTRLVAFAFMMLIPLAYFAAQGTGGLWLVRGEEMLVLLGCVLLVFATIGPGPFSVDATIQRVRSRSAYTTVEMSPWIRRQYRRRELTR